MKIEKLIELLPDSVKADIINFHDNICITVKGKTHDAIRVTIDRLLTDSEKQQMQNKHIVGLECVCHYKYAPEIKKSYFYVI